MLTLKAPAKINWFLFVLGKRPDGYHNIISLLEKIRLFDTLVFEESDSIEVVSEGLSIPTEENLVYKAANLLRKKTGIKTGARITLRKAIPLSAGLAGGSSDAATTLVGLTKLWALNMPEEWLTGVASEIGSDVPFFLGSACAIAEGKGEILRPINMDAERTLLIVKPKEGVSAGWAYRHIERYAQEELYRRIDEFIAAVQSGQFSALKAIEANSLEPAVIKEYPLVAEIKKRLYKQGAIYSAMSGSGTAVFGVFRDIMEAKRAQKAFKGLWSEVVRTLVG